MYDELGNIPRKVPGLLILIMLRLPGDFVDLTWQVGESESPASEETGFG